MPKRGVSSNDLDSIRRKLKKLEEQQKRRRILIQSSSESDSDENASSEHDAIPDVISERDAAYVPEEAADSCAEVVSNATLNPAAETDPEPDLDPELLVALGGPIAADPKFGENIHKSLAQRWEPILKNGLSKEARDKLFKEYPIPSNCTLLQAPKLNREISAAISDASRNRDKKKETEQQQLGVGVTAINKALTLMLKHFVTGDEKIEAIRILSDGCRILTDLHYQETQARRNVLNYALSKPFLNIIQEDSERDETLYGCKLGEKIKASKTVEKQGLSIKKFIKQPKVNSASEHMTSTRPTFRSTGAYPENWAGPSRFQQNKGGAHRGASRSYAPATSRRATMTAPPPTTRPPPPIPSKPRQAAPRR